MRSQSRLTQAISKANRVKRPARIPFLTAGCPDPDKFWDCLKELDDNGADILEIGVPFSDPVADGPVIAAASQKALADGVNLEWILNGLARHSFRSPIVLMSYANPLLQYAWAEAAGQTLSEKVLVSLELLARAMQPLVSGVIVPDVPLEESENFRAAFEVAGIDLIVLVGPNTTSERMGKYAQVAQGYVYVVSVLGTTGVREGLPLEVKATLARARAAFDLPLALGFGVKEPSQLSGLARLPEAVIFGSALVRHLTDGGCCRDFMAPWLEAAGQPAV
ncbi:MAG: tryptophan synthase subunit alpha [Deltaproteobacteria bacterium]|jgi:tryptophan synthase alpha chain|nr:tryptophan synthase subunit alpha [Deltaproteobacteria bacterium]